MPTFSAADIIDKTLIARTNVPVYRHADDSDKPFGYVKKGQPVGVVYTWVAANPAYNRAGLYWAFIDGTNVWYYARHDATAFDYSSLKQQGVLTTEEKIAKEQEEQELADLPWYERLIKKYGIWVLGAAVAASAVRGYFSRPKSSN